jgi:hypothetical protein|tara:strand:+ start:243 stop:470 length:228 start_codon:yes stop_codon:yes gene_type:complete
VDLVVVELVVMLVIHVVQQLELVILLQQVLLKEIQVEMVHPEQGQVMLVVEVVELAVLVVHLLVVHLLVEMVVQV